VTSEIAERFMQTLQQIEKKLVMLNRLLRCLLKMQNSVISMTEPLQGHDGARRFWQKYLSVFEHIRSKFTNVVEVMLRVIKWLSDGAFYQRANPSNTRCERARNRQWTGALLPHILHSAVFCLQGAKKKPESDAI